MDYEKKYKEAIERAKQFSEKPYLEDSKGIVEYIFPELQESEDERIRKALIKLVKKAGEGYENVIDGVSVENAISWLEKQGEHAKFRDSIQVGDKVTRNQDGMLVNLSQLNRVAKKDEKQGEQTPTMIQWKGDNLKEVVDFTGVYKEGFEKWFHNSWEEYEKYVREHNNIFKIFNEDGSHMEVPVGAWIIKAPDGYNTASRFAINPILTELSIESNFKFKKAIEAIENYVNSFPHSQRPEIWQHINFLKSLRPLSTWRPSGEQIKVCKKVYADILSAKGFDLGTVNGELNRLEEELKKLKG